MKTVCLTGAAGFIGFHLAKKLASEGYKVIGLDNLNNYYDKQLKIDRITQLKKLNDFNFIELDISDDIKMSSLDGDFKFDVVINLAAQAGVQYSLENPHEYISSNIKGFLNILELSKRQKVGHLIYASSSSVYGLNKKIPFSEDDNTDHPLSIYAASKKSNELMAHSYSYLYDLPSTGLRFFTVYGPWGRPDMALFLFTKAAIENKTIKVNNYGDHARDFTYVDDIVSGISKIIPLPPQKDNLIKPSPSKSEAPWQVLNIGRGQKVQLMEFIEIIEAYFGKEIKKEFVPLQAGDVADTFCDTTKLKESFNYEPSVSVKEGVKEFLDWYVKYYKI
jgi:UDP-glucuronate 4-epimerase